MMLCLDCGAAFEQAREVVERHGLDTPPYERLLVCPRCGGADLRDTHRCDLCGEWITGKYIETVDGDRICGECYTSHDIDDG
jgi:hypothetical protein